MPNCTTYHNDPARTGWFHGTKTGVPNASAWRKRLDVTLGAAVRGTPLLLESWRVRGGPHSGETHDLLFVVASDNLVNAYSVDQLQAGVKTPFWSTQLPAASRRLGSNIPPPVGITSTPVIDQTAGEMHVLALQSASKLTSPETSPRAPAVCAHNGQLYIAWKGDGNDNLNVAQVQIAGSTITGLINKVTLGDTSPVSPTLASLNGRLYIGWKGDGNDNLNVMYSADNGHTFGNKFTSPETSPQPPALCSHNGNLYIGWKGDGNDNLNVAQVQISGTAITGFTNKVTLGDTSPLSPTLASLNGRLYIGWKGDGNDNLNVMYSADNGHTFGNKNTSSETSPQAPGLCEHNGNLYITWKGDGNDNLNAAQVLISENSITGLDKVILTDTSPLSPALASVNDRLYIAWKGDGNDNLNVMCLTSPGEIGDYMESVVRLSVDGRSLSVADWYTPLNAKSLDDQDLDIGGSSAMVLPPIGGLQTVVVTGKDGNVYLLNRLQLGHWGGALWREPVFNSESKCAPAFYRSPAGDNRVFVIGGGLPGLAAYEVIASGSTASLRQIWQATGAGIGLGDFPGSPAVQSFPDWDDAVVWVVDDTIPALRGFRAGNGTQLFNSASRSTDALPAIPHFPPITCATSGVFVGTNRGFSYYGP